MRETFPPISSARPVDNERQVNIVRYACAGIVFMLMAGIWLKLPYLIMEHRRLEPWKILELWSADVLALFWFVRFTMLYAIAEEALGASRIENGRQRLKSIATIGLAVIAIDLLLTLHLMYDEHARFTKGIITEAQATSIHKSERELESWYELKCQFRDEMTRPRHVTLRVEAKGHVFPAALPAETVQALTSGTPGQVRIRYDPKFPNRAWIEGAGWMDGDTIYWFSLLTLFFQSAVTALFLIFLAVDLKNNILPWWWDVYKVLPLAVAAFWLFFIGLIDWIMGS
jgi:hypothetical protein